MTEPTRQSAFLGRKFVRVGRFRVSSYAAMLYLGFVLGVALGLSESRLDPTRFCATALILLVPALLGGRLWYVLGHPEIRSRSWDLPSGGAGLYGGLVLSFALSWPVLRLLGLPFWRFWDAAALVLLVGMTVTRMGCLMAGCCAGRETHGPFGVWLPDHTGRWLRRYPTQLLEMVWSAAILAVGLWLYAPTDRPGALFFGAAGAYAIGRLWLEPLRAEAAMDNRSTHFNLAFSGLLATAAAMWFVVTVW